MGKKEEKSVPNLKIKNILFKDYWRSKNILCIPSIFP